MEWTEAGVAGASRFVQRLYRLGEGLAELARSEGGRPPPALGSEALALRRATHRTIAAVTEAFEGFGFNVAVARLHEFANHIADADRSAASDGLSWALREAASVLVRLVAPMMPHLAEALHALLWPGSDVLVAELPWPEPDPAMLQAETITIAVQILGRLRGTISMPPGSEAAAVIAAAAAEPNVARLLAGRRIVRQIHVPDRVVNFVVAD